MEKGTGDSDPEGRAVPDERSLLAWLSSRQPLRFVWSPLQDTGGTRPVDLMLAGRLVFPDGAAPRQLLDRQNSRQTPLLWLEKPDLSPVMREKFTGLLQATDRAIETIPDHRIAASPLDLEVALVAMLTKRFNLVSAFRYPYLPCSGMFPAVVECALADRNATSRPIVIHDGAADLRRTYGTWNNGTRRLTSLFSWRSFGRAKTSDPSRTGTEPTDVLEVRYLSLATQAWDECAPSMGLFHLALTPEPEILPELVRRMRATRAAGLILYSPGAAAVEEQLTSLGVRFWRVPRVALANLQQTVRADSGRPTRAGLVGATPRVIAEDGWRLDALPISDRELNWAFSGLIGELSVLSGIAIPGTDSEVDRAISAIWGFLVAAEATTAPIAQLDRQLARTRWGFPFSRRREGITRTLGDFEATHPDYSRDVAYVGQLSDIIMSRLEHGAAGKPAATLQMVRSAQRTGSVLVVVACSNAMARSTDAFLNVELEKAGASGVSNWLVTSASEVLRSPLPELLHAEGISSGQQVFVNLPICRHGAHSSLLGLPLARRVVALMYQSQTSLYLRTIVAATQDAPSRLDSDRSQLLHIWAQGGAVPRTAVQSLSNITSSPLPTFPIGKILPNRPVADVVRDVSAIIRNAVSEASLAEQAELRQPSAIGEPQLAEPSVRGVNAEALLILLDDELQVFVTPGHRVFVIDVTRGDVTDSTARNLVPGERILATAGSVQYSIDQSLLELLAESPEWAHQIRYRSLWVETLRTWMDLPHSTPLRFLRELTARGSQIQTEQAIKFWLDNVVIGPKNDTDVPRIAEICNSPKLKRYADMVISSIHDLRGIRQQVVEAVVKEALQGRMDGMSPGAIATHHAGMNSPVDQLVRDTTTHIVRSVEDPRLVDVGLLNVITKSKR
jgi:hypothetical protein